MNSNRNKVYFKGYAHNNAKYETYSTRPTVYRWVAVLGAAYLAVRYCLADLRWISLDVTPSTAKDLFVCFGGYIRD